MILLVKLYSHSDKTIDTNYCHVRNITFMIIISSNFMSLQFILDAESTSVYS